MRHFQSLINGFTALAPALLLTAFLATSTDSSAKELYRWTDEKGVTHYSDTKPEGVDFERRKLANEPVPPPPTPAETDTKGAEKAKEAAKPAKPAGPSPECIQARANLDVLRSAPEVSMDTDGDGEPETLDADGRQAAIANHQALITQLCAD